MSRIVEAARGWIGTPYRHQCSVRGMGCDCLGLLRGVWREVIGPEPEQPPPYSPDWDEVGRRDVLAAAAERWLAPTTPLAPGVVILFRMRRGAVAKHIGICSRAADQPAFIHAYSGHGVLESSLSDAWARRIAALYTIPGGD